MALDGFSQMLTDYESTAFMRLITGTPFGIFVGAFLASSLSARPLYFSKDPSRVLLPSGSRFLLVLKKNEIIEAVQSTTRLLIPLRSVELGIQRDHLKLGSVFQ